MLLSSCGPAALVDDQRLVGLDGDFFFADHFPVDRLDPHVVLARFQQQGVGGVLQF